MGELRIETERLVLREWREDDAEALYPMGQDPRVMEFLGPLEDRDKAQWLVEGQIVNQRLFGHCFWPVERRSDGALLGYCGLNPGPEATPLEGKIEIGWRLASHAWGQGFAREAAGAALDWGFASLAVGAIWSMTVPTNSRSWGLMERLGLSRHAELDFDHPGVPVDSPLKRHITYSITRDQWTAPAS